MHESNLKHQQITIDSQLFEQIVDCLAANCGGDAACNLVLNQLQSLGLYDRLGRAGGVRQDKQEKFNIASLAPTKTEEISSFDRASPATLSDRQARCGAVRQFA